MAGVQQLAHDANLLFYGSDEAKRRYGLPLQLHFLATRFGPYPFAANGGVVVDGTLLEAWASQKSFRPRDEEPPVDGGGNPTVNFHGERRRNATHQSSTDPDARLYKKAVGREARLGYLGHVLMEHRSGLVVNAMVTPADGYGERDAALVMVAAVPGRHRITVAGDKAFDTRAEVAALRHMGATPHLALNAERPGGSALDRRTTRHPGYAISQRKRKLVEQAFGWMKTVGGLRKLRHRGGGGPGDGGGAGAARALSSDAREAPLLRAGAPRGHARGEGLGAQPGHLTEPDGAVHVRAVRSRDADVTRRS